MDLSVSSANMLSETQAKLAKTSHDLYAQWRTAELLGAVFSCLGIVTATIDYEQGFPLERSYSNCIIYPQEAYRWLTLICTLIGMGFLLLRHQKKNEWYRFRPLPWVNATQTQKQEHRKQHQQRSKTPRILGEWFLLLIFPYPYLDGHINIDQEWIRTSTDGKSNAVSLCYNISELLYVAMFVRLIFLLRALFNMTPYHSDHARIYCARNGTSANVRFSVRCMMKTHSLLLIMCFTLPSFFIFAVMLRVFERPYTDISRIDFESYWNSVWCVAVTISTVGYGAIFPATHFGRAIAIICAVWGAFAFSMLVFAFESNLFMTYKQAQAFTEIKVGKAAISVVVHALRLNVIKNNYGTKSMGAQTQEKKLEHALHEYKVTKKNLKSMKSKREHSEHVMKNQYKKIKLQMDRIEAKLDLLLSNRQ